MEDSHILPVSHQNEKISRKSKKHLTKSTNSVFEAINNKWPTNPLEIAQELGETPKGNVKRLSSKYVYHFKKLKKLGLIDMKKLGNTYVAWPMDMEKLRVLHEIIREGD